MPLPVTAETVAARLGLSLSNAATRVLIEGAINDAMADVEAYLGRAITPRTYVEHGCWAVYGGYDLTPLDEPVRSITSAVAETVGDPPEPTGYYTVTYVAGLDCTEPDKRPILRYITSAVMNAPEVLLAWQRERGERGQITSVSAEGQSISYSAPSFGGGGAAGSGAPGALPTLASLDRWRLAGRRVFTRKSTLAEAWPYDTPSWSGEWPF